MNDVHFGGRNERSEKLGMKKPKRHDNVIRVPVLPHERRAIEENAAAAGLPLAVYLRKVGMGMPIRPVIDLENIVELSKINADQGRLGGLLKLWLTDKKKDGLEIDIRKLLRQIEKIQKLFLNVLEKF